MAFNSFDFLFNQLLALFPKGPIWEIKNESDLEKTISAMAKNQEEIFDFLISLKDLRNPLLTPILEDLEKEFGIVSDSTLSEATRRSAVAAIKYNTDSNGSIDQLQQAIDNAGFQGVFVYSNNPAVDPASLANGEILVNNLSEGDQNRYSNPTNNRDWPLVFFVGGAATTGSSGEITSIADVNIDVRRFEEFKNLIIRIKPLHSWCYYFINFTQTNNLDFGFDLEPNTFGFSDFNNTDLGGSFITGA